jgi:hypothetical protein
VVLEIWQEFDAISLGFENGLSLKKLISAELSKERLARDSEKKFFLAFEANQQLKLNFSSMRHRLQITFLLQQRPSTIDKHGPRKQTSKSIYFSV